MSSNEASPGSEGNA